MRSLVGWMRVIELIALTFGCVCLLGIKATLDAILAELQGNKDELSRHVSSLGKNQNRGN